LRAGTWSPLCAERDKWLHHRHRDPSSLQPDSRDFSRAVDGAAAAEFIARGRGRLGGAEKRLTCMPRGRPSLAMIVWLAPHRFRNFRRGLVCRCRFISVSGFFFLAYFCLAFIRILSRVCCVSRTLPMARTSTSAFRAGDSFDLAFLRPFRSFAFLGERRIRCLSDDGR